MAQQWQSDTPIYLQLYQQVVSRILDGNIQEGEALPSVRKVAAEYQLNPLTISKAYQMLQEEQIVEKQRGKGLFVKAGVQGLILARERQLFLEQQWPSIIEKIERLQLSPEQLLLSTREKGTEEK
ncbi:GntR family transcriptional regulator [Endozoicomonas sp. G2_1]|uniref:GntR family transcriptional regulator n=1 Tax=Endozoicomonas sp. G2_1 TaxID=2821091 RepID=UPI001ADA400C|nr:GntR family transcriptional regulator [Endozoicomonas sp. G2_1]MBO9489771.1 GntR family transcriptional regulator [Endozoicomonas sp. G2_1]